MSIEPILLRLRETESAWEQLVSRVVLCDMLRTKTKAKLSYRWVVAVGDDR